MLQCPFIESIYNLEYNYRTQLCIHLASLILLPVAEMFVPRLCLIDFCVTIYPRNEDKHAMADKNYQLRMKLLLYIVKRKISKNVTELEYIIKINLFLF